jgi:hypothetical protein
MKNAQYYRYIKIVILGLLASLIAIAAIWSMKNFVNEPRYGDTPEYWALSQTLSVDSWRTIGYPLLLKLARNIGNIPTARCLIYALQIIISYIAALYFFNTLNMFSVVSLKKKTIYLLALVFVSMPLITHFNLSILTDSLANSLFIIGISVIARFIFLDKFNKSDFAVGSMAILASCLIRAERALIFSIILSLCIVWLWLAIRDRKKLLMFAVFPVFVIAAFLLNHGLQKPSQDRPPLNVTASVFNRVSRTIIYDRYANMPALIQSRIDPQLAHNWQNNDFYGIQVLNKLKDSDGTRAMRSAIKNSLLCCSLHIGKEIVGDFLEYIFAPITYIKESLFVHTDPTWWTNTRMSMFSPILTMVYVRLSFVLTAALITFSAARYKTPQVDKRFVIFLSLVILLLVLMFTLNTSLDFHIRYGLPIYSIETGLFLWFGLAGFFIEPSIKHKAKS